MIPEHVDLCPFQVLSLCSGAGGLELGLKLAIPNSRTVCYVEREAFACEILATRMQEEALDDAPIWTDIRTFSGRPWRGKVHCLTGGYPCQPFSVSGLRRGREDPRHLWPEVARIIGESRPEWVFCENVPGHLSLGFREVEGELCSMGYQVEAGLFTAAEVGASHKRQRLFILAHSQYSLRWPSNEKRNSAGEREDQKRETASAVRELCSLLGNSDSQGLERWKLSDSQCTNEWIAGSPSCSLFPPFPDDLEGWRRYLELSPETQPAVCGSINGVAHRVDRIRLGGNGVVPLVAAYAFCTLSSRFENDR